MCVKTNKRCAREQLAHVYTPNLKSRARRGEGVVQAMAGREVEAKAGREVVAKDGRDGERKDLEEEQRAAL